MSMAHKVFNHSVLELFKGGLDDQTSASNSVCSPVCLNYRLQHLSETRNQFSGYPTSTDICCVIYFISSITDQNTIEEIRIKLNH